MTILLQSLSLGSRNWLNWNKYSCPQNNGLTHKNLLNSLYGIKRSTSGHMLWGRMVHFSFLADGQVVYAWSKPVFAKWDNGRVWHDIDTEKDDREMMALD